MKYKLTTLLIIKLSLKDHSETENPLAEDNKEELISKKLEEFKTLVGDFGGNIEPDSLGKYPDRFLACFDGPSGALAAAFEYAHKLSDSNIEMYCAINTGEIIIRNNAIMGRTLDIVSKMLKMAEKNEILFSESVLLSAGADTQLTYHPNIGTIEGLTGPKTNIFRLDLVKFKESGDKNGES